MRQGCGERGRYSGRVEGEAGRGAQAGDSGRNQGRRETMILYLIFLSISSFLLFFALFLSIYISSKGRKVSPPCSYRSIYFPSLLSSISLSFFFSLPSSLALSQCLSPSLHLSTPHSPSIFLFLLSIVSPFFPSLSLARSPNHKITNKIKYLSSSGRAREGQVA